MHVPIAPDYTRTSQSSTLESIPVRESSSPRFTSRSDNYSSEDEDEAFLFDTPSPQTPSASTAGYIASQATALAKIALDQFSFAISPPNYSSKGGIYRFLLEKMRQQPRTFYCEEHRKIEPTHVIDKDISTLSARHLACPFYLHQKEKYLSCLTRTDMREIRDLKRHLWTAHHQLSYCPTCNDTFSVTEDWENHIRLKSCTPSGKARPEGITRLQVQELAQRTNTRISREAQWLWIWEIVFPGVEPPSPEVVSGKVETVVWVLRDFWSAEGGRIVSSFLTERQQHISQLQLQNNESIATALGSLVLDRVIDQLVESCRQGERGEP